MIKLLIMNDKVHDGGAEKVMEELIQYLPKEIYDITIISIVNDYDNIKKFYPSSINYFSVEKAFKYSKGRKNIVIKVIDLLKMEFYKLLYKLKINYNNYDIVIAMKEGQCMKFLSKVKAKKKYAWVHVDYKNLHWTKSLFKTFENELNCMKCYNNIICVSDTAKNSVCDIIGNPGNLLVKTNPINVNQIIEKSNEKIECLENYNAKNKPILVSVGGLREEKGFIRLLECCKNLNEHFEYELWIVGDGEKRAEMEEYIKTYNLNNIILWGNQNNPYPFVKMADWFVSSSFAESYGLAVQEALVLNVPVIATTCLAFEECISQNEGILVKNTTEGLYKGLYDILNNIDFKKKYKNNISLRLHKDLYIHRLEEIEKLWK